MNQKINLESNFVNALLFVVLFNYGLVHFCVLRDEVAAAALRDYGYISVLTIGLLLTAEVLALCLAFSSVDKVAGIGFYALGYVLQVYLWREADLHKFFTHKSVTSIRYYRGDYPLPGKIIAGALLLVFIVAFAYIILRYGLPVIKAFFRGEAWAVAVGVWGVLLVGSQIWDKSPFNKEALYGWRITLIEEYVEFCAAAYLVGAIILYILQREKAVVQQENG
jgi:hypothetical protein